MQKTTLPIEVTFYKAGQIATATDTVTVEEPMETRLRYGVEKNWQEKNIAVTMRTPGHDEELAVGFLFTEGVIQNSENVASVQTNGANITIVALKNGIAPELKNTSRNFYTTSSCGVCGKASIDAVHAASSMADAYPLDTLRISVSDLLKLPEVLKAKQTIFEQTGGIHACAIFDKEGNLLLVREDVGRHNALDKLIGRALLDGLLPLQNHVLLLSGRVSFELVQKAAMAGIKVVGAVGAPSSLAIQMAEEWNMTLIGFLRDNRCNVYCGKQRIVF
jgi:FdhD protein